MNLRCLCPKLALVFVVFMNSCATSPASRDSARTTSQGECFGVPYSFSGRLSPDQEARVPEALRGAFYIESVRHMTSTNFEMRAKDREIIAEETRNGERYVALRDYRCVDFGNGVSGLMIVVERYRITNGAGGGEQ